MWKAPAAVVTAFILAACSAPAWSQCIFDESYFKPEYYTSKESVRAVLWIKERNEAKIITAEGDLLSVQHWSCDTLGLQADMFIIPSLQRDQEIKSKLLVLAGIVLRAPEQASLSGDLAKRPAITVGALNKIPGPENREFSYSLARFPSFDLLTVKYSYN
jgi:hypothetical protein